MFERIRRLPGEVLTQDAYRREFQRSYGQIQDVFWKLERNQFFREPGDSSWEAMMAGRWDEAMTIDERDRLSIMEHFRRVAARGVESRRVRIIERPFTPYLRWELHYLKLTAEAGARIRVLDAAEFGKLEADGQLPELVILGSHVMYQVLYDATWAPDGARRLVQPDVIAACRAAMEALYQRGEDLLPFYEREIAPLLPRTPNRA